MADADARPHHAMALDPEIARLVELGRWNDAAQRLEALIEEIEKPRDKADLLIELGDIWHLRLGHQSAAVDAYERALPLAPEDNELLERLMAIYERRKDLRSMIEILEQLADRTIEDDLRVEMGRKATVMRATAFDEYDDILVELTHPWVDGPVPLKDWMAQGPGEHPAVRPIAARSARWGCELPLSLVPFDASQSVLARALIKLGVVKPPWKSE